MSSIIDLIAPPSHSVRMSPANSPASSPFDLTKTGASADHTHELDDKRIRHSQYYLEERNMAFLVSSSLLAHVYGFLIRLQSVHRLNIHYNVHRSHFLSLPRHLPRTRSGTRYILAPLRELCRLRLVPCYSLPHVSPHLFTRV